MRASSTNFETKKCLSRWGVGRPSLLTWLQVYCQETALCVFCIAENRCLFFNPKCEGPLDINDMFGKKGLVVTTTKPYYYYN